MEHTWLSCGRYRMAWIYSRNGKRISVTNDTSTSSTQERKANPIITKDGHVSISIPTWPCQCGNFSTVYLHCFWNYWCGPTTRKSLSTMSIHWWTWRGLVGSGSWYNPAMRAGLNWFIFMSRWSLLWTSRIRRIIWVRFLSRSSNTWTWFRNT